jgi:dTDP-4-dehydrorhamnose reductase
MKILVTGRSGQVARSLAERAAGREDLSLAFAARPDFDLEHPSSIQGLIAAEAPDLIVNAAAYTAVDQAEDEAKAARQANTEAPGVIAAAAAAAGAKLIHISTDYVFDGAKASPYSEDDPIAPLNVYGQTKADGEAAVRAVLKDHVILRTSWVYSPFGRNFVKTMLSLAAERDRLTVVDDQIGSPTSALDIADAILAIADRRSSSAALSGTYHFAASGSASWAEFARQIFEISRQEGGPFAEVAGISSEQWPTKAIRPRNSRLDTSRFTAAFGHSPPHWAASLVLVVRRLLSEMPTPSGRAPRLSE